MEPKYKRQRRFRGPSKSNEPIMRTPLQRGLWKAVKEAPEPIGVKEIYEALPPDLKVGDYKNQANVFIFGWVNRGWLQPHGKRPNTRYSITVRTEEQKEIQCPKL